MPNKQHIARLARQGQISRGALKRWLANSVPDDVADNGTVGGVVEAGSNHINRGRTWPQGATVKGSNNLKGWSKQRGPVQSSGPIFGRPSSRKYG
jgi:hypothetical protein